ncbi:MAG: hypothetical protein HQM16_14090 [Deltaproteobacteria bacterium]|nr:hypothetical protein [Deltaproteobacteria bacterium]
MTDMTGCVAVGGEMGTSSSKFCCDDTLVLFSSVVGDALTDSMEKSWRIMNRSADKRWVKNLAVFDEGRNSWRYVGSMTRLSEKSNWFTNKGLIQNYDDAFLAIKAGLFLLNEEMQKKGKPLKRVGFGFGITVRHGENVIEKFLAYIKDKLTVRDGKKFLKIKAKNVATEEVKEIEIWLDFSVMQYQAYGAYISILFSRYKMEVYNTYVIDIGHGTWIKLPIVDNEADIILADSMTEGIHTITKNISTKIFESSEQKFKIPEQRIMERLPAKDYVIEIPGVGRFDFGAILAEQSQYMARHIAERVSNDIAALSEKGHMIEFYTVIGGGAHLLYDTIKKEIANYFGWKNQEADQRFINPADLGVDPRYINCVGFMLLARDQIALESDKDVDPHFNISNVIQDIKSEEEK